MELMIKTTERLPEDLALSSTLWWETEIVGTRETQEPPSLPLNI